MDFLISIAAGLFCGFFCAHFRHGETHVNFFLEVVSIFGFKKEIYRESTKYFIVSAIFLLFSVALHLVQPLLIKIIIDYNFEKVLIENKYLNHAAELLFEEGELLQNLLMAGAAIIAFTVIKEIAFFIKSITSAEGAERIAKNLKDTLYEHMHRLDYKYHVNAESGELIKRSTTDVETLRKFLANQFVEIIRIVVMLVIIFIFMVNMSVKMTMYSLILVPFIIAYSGYFRMVVEKGFGEVEKAEADFTTIAQENLTGIKVVRAFNRKEYEKDKFDEKNTLFRDKLYILIRNMGFYWGISDFLSLMQVLIIIGVGIGFVIRGEITVGSYAAFVSYGNMLVWPVRLLGRLLTDFGKAVVARRRILEILEEEEEDFSGTFSDIEGNISFRDVSFSYGEHEILKNVNLDITPGKIIGIVGPTGSGKTTIANLLVGLIDPDSGAVTVDGRPIAEIDKKTLRKRISLILQNTFLFAKSIEENIAITTKQIVKEDIERVARISSIHDSIEKFEEGYETLIGEKGVSLSGGQKQRVSIARKLMEDARVLVFDDTLSAVDIDTEIKIISSLKELRGGVGMVIITHRITSIIDADEIYVIEKGRVTARGTHDELKVSSDYYRTICDIQLKEKEENHE